MSVCCDRVLCPQKTVPKIQKILTIDDGFKVVCPRRRCDDDATTVRARKWCVPDDVSQRRCARESGVSPTPVR